MARLILNGSLPVVYTKAPRDGLTCQDLELHWEDSVLTPQGTDTEGEVSDCLTNSSPHRIRPFQDRVATSSNAGHQETFYIPYGYRINNVL